MIIGLSGLLASGKDTVADYLSEKENFQHISISKILREVICERGMEINLENLTKVGNSLADNEGPQFLVEKAIAKLDKTKDAVISSVRQPGEIERLREESNFFMIFVTADSRVRFDRLLKRGRLGDVKDFDEFLEVEKKQLDGASGGMNLNRCQELSDYVLENDGTLEEFEGKIRQTLSDIKKRVQSGK